MSPTKEEIANGASEVNMKVESGGVHVPRSSYSISGILGMGAHPPNSIPSSKRKHSVESAESTGIWRVLFVVSKLCDGIFFVRKPYTQTRPSAHAYNCFVILSLPRARKFVYI